MYPYIYVCVCVCACLPVCVLTVSSVSKDDFCSFCGSENQTNTAGNPIWVTVLLNCYETLIHTLTKTNKNPRLYMQFITT